MAPFNFFSFFFLVHHSSFPLLWFANSFQFTSNLEIYFMNPLPVKIPIFLSSPVTAKMQERESYPPNLTIAYPISCYFLIPSQCFLKNRLQTSCMNSLLDQECWAGASNPPRNVLDDLVRKNVNYRFCSNPLGNIALHRSLLIKPSGQILRFHPYLLCSPSSQLLPLSPRLLTMSFLLFKCLRP